MFKMGMVWMGIALAGAGWLQAAGLQSPNQATPSSPNRALSSGSGVPCHNERLRTANLLLDQADVENPSAGAEVWEKVIRKLRTRAMPPAGMPRPDESTYDSFATYLETAIDQ